MMMVKILKYNIRFGYIYIILYIKGQRKRIWYLNLIKIYDSITCIMLIFQIWHTHIPNIINILVFLSYTNIVDYDCIDIIIWVPGTICPHY